MAAFLNFACSPGCYSPGKYCRKADRTILNGSINETGCRGDF